MSCKNICSRYRATRPNSTKNFGSYSRYGNGQKRCQVCEIFIKWEGLRCPCCQTSLRTRPRPRRCRDKL